MLTWDQITRALAAAAGVEARIVHVPSDAINALDPQWGAGLLGDKAHARVFDTSKLRRVVPDFSTTVRFEQGAREIVAWHDADPARRPVDPEFDAVSDQLVARFAVALRGLLRNETPGIVILPWSRWGPTAPAYRGVW